MIPYPVLAYRWRCGQWAGTPEAGGSSTPSSCGRPHDKLGEVPIAFVVRTAGSQLSAEQVLALFDGRVAPYKRPRDVIFLNAIPRTPVGKSEKKALRALAAPSA